MNMAEARAAAVLTLNAGSSSIKFAFFELVDGQPLRRFEGQVERIGTEPQIRTKDAAGTVLTQSTLSGAQADGHAGAMAAILDVVEAAGAGKTVVAVGHRIVHGGPDRAAPAIVDDALIAELERVAPFAPLHQPHNLAGVRAAQRAFPGTPQIACFDTAFHRGHAWVDDVFALPREFHERGVRRYGFHGISYDYIASRLAEIEPDLHAGRVVVAHLGNGASMCAMKGGRSVTSTMGFSALEGLPMGTRAGRLDPGVMLYLLQQEGMAPSEVSDLLYKRSGLLGLSGISNDMRTLEASDAPEARQAIEYFVVSIQRELGSLAAALGGLDALVFTGGIGEHSELVRRGVCETLQWIGIDFDDAANRSRKSVISAPSSAVKVLVIPTDEESVIAAASVALVS